MLIRFPHPMPLKNTSQEVIFTFGQLIRNRLDLRHSFTEQPTRFRKQAQMALIYPKHRAVIHFAHPVPTMEEQGSF